MGDSLLDKELKDDLALFSYETFCYLAARRICFHEFPQVKAPVEGSRFIEEIGKAVLVTWHKDLDSYRQKLSDDFPKYLDTAENFERYFMCVAREIENELDLSYFTEQLLRVTAFLLELCHYCLEKGHADFFPRFVTNWYKMFLKIFYPRFKAAYSWDDFYSECLERSDEYDREKVEKGLDRGCAEFALRYFTPKDIAGKIKLLTKTFCCRKAVSKFHTLDRKTWTLVLPDNVPTRSRQEQLDYIKHVIAKSRTESQDEGSDLIKLALDRYVYLMIRKMKSSKMIADKFRRDHLEMKRQSKARLRDKEREENPRVNRTKADGDKRKIENEGFARTGEGLPGKFQEHISDVAKQYLDVIGAMKRAPKKYLKAKNREPGQYEYQNIKVEDVWFSLGSTTVQRSGLGRGQQSSN